MLLAGIAYDSFTSPAILSEVAEVLGRPRFGANIDQVSVWLDAYVRASRQVFPESIPGDYSQVVGSDADDLSVLKTAYAVFAAGSEYPAVLEKASRGAGFFVISENTNHFAPEQNTYGFRFIRAHTFLREVALNQDDEESHS
jgi:hypothetical protein